MSDQLLDNCPGFPSSAEHHGVRPDLLSVLAKILSLEEGDDEKDFFGVVAYHVCEQFGAHYYAVGHYSDIWSAIFQGLPLVAPPMADDSTLVWAAILNLHPCASPEPHLAQWLGDHEWLEEISAVVALERSRMILRLFDRQATLMADDEGRTPFGGIRVQARFPLGRLRTNCRG